MSAVRILILTVRVPFVHGGAEILADSLREALIAAGHQVEIVALPFKWYPPEQLLVLQSEAYFANPRPIYQRILEFLDVPIWVPFDFEHANATAAGSVDANTRRRLIGAFREPNERLFELIGERFSWQ